MSSVGSGEHEPRREDVACDFCGARDSTAVWTGLRDRDTGADETFSIVRCRRCRLVYLNPRPNLDQIGRYYPPDYLPHVSSLLPPPRRGRLKSTLRRITRLPYDLRYPGSPEVFPPPYSGATLLDVGCGAGSYLASMAELGWHAYGIEPSPSAAALARAQLGDETRVLVGRAGSMSLAPNRYDCITMWHVLEHVHSPRAALAAIAPALRPGGTLRLAVPNVGSAEARAFRRWWSHLDVPRHLYHFDLDTLGAYLTEAGFETVAIRPQWFPSSISDSINNVVEDITHRRYRRPNHWLTYYGVAPCASLSYVLGNRGAIDVTAVRVV